MTIKNITISKLTQEGTTWHKNLLPRHLHGPILEQPASIDQQTISCPLFGIKNLDGVILGTVLLITFVGGLT